MDNHGEVSVLDFLRLMKDYVEGRIDAEQYRTTYFALLIKRMIVKVDESRILQQGYGDADDYDPTVTLPYTLEESQLRERVAKSIAELESLGYATT